MAIVDKPEAIDRKLGPLLPAMKKNRDAIDIAIYELHEHGAYLGERGLSDYVKEKYGVELGGRRVRDAWQRGKVLKTHGIPLTFIEGSLRHSDASLEFGKSKLHFAFYTTKYAVDMVYIDVYEAPSQYADTRITIYRTPNLGDVWDEKVARDVIMNGKVTHMMMSTEFEGQPGYNRRICFDDDDGGHFSVTIKPTPVIRREEGTDHSWKTMADRVKISAIDEAAKARYKDFKLESYVNEGEV